MKLIELCRDYYIPNVTGGHKHSRPGWVNLRCPFCTGHEGFHLGFDTQNSRFHCWRCGGHKPMDTIQALLNVSRHEAIEIYRKYQGRSRHNPSPIPKMTHRVREVKWPVGTKRMKNQHLEYLIKRGFNPEELEKIWDLKGTGIVGPYKNRVIAPIYFKGKMVSYQGRDITGQSKLRYKACPKALEIMDHKHTLYGLDLVEGDAVIVVEGVTDVWRFGPGAVDTYGVEYTRKQITLLSKFSRVFIIYDPEDQATRQAFKLAGYLSGFCNEVEVITDLPCDPGDLNPDEARYIKKQLLGEI